MLQTFLLTVLDFIENTYMHSLDTIYRDDSLLLYCAIVRSSEIVCYKCSTTTVITILYMTMFFALQLHM